VPACWVGLLLALPVVLAPADDEVAGVELDGGVLLELLHAATVNDIAASPAASAVTERTLYAVRRCLNLVMWF
jgi:hypothetical protein